MDLLAPQEISRVEREFADGLSARTVLEIFAPRGVRLSEATFRKYVQAGLLPRSRRVGRKGKHRGSQGLYPVEAVRRINAIKKMMAEGLTLEEIRGSFVFFKSRIDEIEAALGEMLAGLETALEEHPLPRERKASLRRDLRDVRGRSQDLMHEIATLGSAVTARRTFDDG